MAEAQATNQDGDKLIFLHPPTRGHPEPPDNLDGSSYTIDWHRRRPQGLGAGNLIACKAFGAGPSPSLQAERPIALHAEFTHCRVPRPYSSCRHFSSNFSISRDKIAGYIAIFTDCGQCNTK